MQDIEEYRKLPRALKHQLSKIQANLQSVKDVQRYYRKCVEAYRGEINGRISKILIRMAILNVMSPMELFSNKWFGLLYCYHDNKEKSIVTLTKVIKTGKHARVMEGIHHGRPVVVKWYQSSKRDTTYELNFYQKLRGMGCDVPWFSSHYNFWGHKVMVLEKLSPLTQYDDEFKMGVHIIQQLRLLHRMGVHCDIKPQNVMKRQINKRTAQYLLIDFGGVATERLSYGYRRWLWSPKWTSQTPHEADQVVTEKNDFLELAYTMRAMQNWRDSHNQSDGDVKRGFTGRLARYLKRVEEIDKRHVRDQDYTDLLRILTH